MNTKIFFFHSSIFIFFFLIVFINWTVSVPHNKGVRGKPVYSSSFEWGWLNRISIILLMHLFFPKKFPCDKRIIHFCILIKWHFDEILRAPFGLLMNFKLYRRLSLSFTAEIGREQTDLNAAGRGFDHPIFNLLIIGKKNHYFLNLKV